VWMACICRRLLVARSCVLPQPVQGPSQPRCATQTGLLHCRRICRCFLLQVLEVRKLGWCGYWRSFTNLQRPTCVHAFDGEKWILECSAGEGICKVCVVQLSFLTYHYFLLFFYERQKTVVNVLQTLNVEWLWNVVHCNFILSSLIQFNDRNV